MTRRNIEQSARRHQADDQAALVPEFHPKHDITLFAVWMVIVVVAVVMAWAAYFAWGVK